MPDSRHIEPLGPGHDRGAFDCGEPLLDVYLQRQASQDVRRRVARVFVMIGDTPDAIIGYYNISAASFERTELPEAHARRLPCYPVPAAIIGRLTVDRRYQGRGYGETLLLDAITRVARVSNTLAVYAVFVDAKRDAASRFCARYGFQPFATNDRRLFLPHETFLKAGLLDP